jgi:DNA-directed RNA polymerase sigma subunit (sigma70/sigma32)
MVRSRPHLIDTVNGVVRTLRRMVNEIGREPTPEKVAAKLSMPLEKSAEVARNRGSANQARRIRGQLRVDATLLNGSDARE